SDLDAGRLERLDLFRGRALAARDDRARVAHALAGRRRAACDERRDRLLHVRLDPRGSLLLRAAADLADHDDPVRVGIVVEEREQIDEVHPADRIAADADARRLPDPERRELTDRLVRERARLREHADVPLLVDVPRHDADLALARRDDARAVRADEPHARAIERAARLYHVEHR